VKQVAQQHITVLEQKITELTQMKSALETLVSRCHGDDNSDCPILDELAQPSGACCHKAE
jgi:hypothetical protein